MKILRKRPDKFRAECPECFAYLEYDKNDILDDDFFSGCIQCPCCFNFFSHTQYAKPVLESEDTE